MTVRQGPSRFFVGYLISILTVFAALWTWAAVGKMWFFDREYPMWLAKMQMMSGCLGDKVVIVGDSRAMAGFVPQYIDDSVVNAALGGATPIEAYYSVKRLLQCPEAPRKIVLSISPYHLTAADVYWTRPVLFHFFSWTELEEIRRRSKALDDATLYETGRLADPINIARNSLHAVDFPYYYLAWMRSATRPLATRQLNEAIVDRTKSDRGYVYPGGGSGSTQPGQEATLARFAPPALFDEYLRKTIALCRDRNIPVVFVSAPMNWATYARLSAQFRSDVVAYLRAVESREKMPIVGDPLPVMASSAFGDEGHLSEAGAIAWTKTAAASIVP